MQGPAGRGKKKLGFFLFFWSLWEAIWRVLKQGSDWIDWIYCQRDPSGCCVEEECQRSRSGGRAARAAGVQVLKHPVAWAGIGDGRE